MNEVGIQTHVLQIHEQRASIPINVVSAGVHKCVIGASGAEIHQRVSSEDGILQHPLFPVSRHL